MNKFIWLLIAFYPLYSCGQQEGSFTQFKSFATRLYVKDYLMSHEPALKDTAAINTFFGTNSFDKQVSYDSLNKYIADLKCADCSAALKKITGQMKKVSFDGLGIIDKESFEQTTSTLIDRIEVAIPSEIKEKLTHFSDVKTILLGEAKTQFSKFVPFDAKYSIDTLTQRLDSILNVHSLALTAIGKKFTFFDLSTFNIVFLLLIISLLGLGYLCFHIYQRLEKHGYDIHTMKKNKQEADDSRFFKASSQESSFTISKSEFNYLKDEVERLSRKSEKTEASNQSREYFAPPPPPSPPIADLDIFYMSAPVGNFFPLSAKSNSKENTLYRFKVMSNKSEAEFEVHTVGAPVKEVVGMVETYIKPACEELNLPLSKVTDIKTERPGFAVLEGDKWLIKTKAKIRYE